MENTRKALLAAIQAARAACKSDESPRARTLNRACNDPGCREHLARTAADYQATRDSENYVNEGLVPPGRFSTPHEITKQLTAIEKALRIAEDQIREADTRAQLDFLGEVAREMRAAGVPVGRATSFHPWSHVSALRKAANAAVKARRPGRGRPSDIAEKRLLDEIDRIVFEFDCSDKNTVLEIALGAAGCPNPVEEARRLLETRRRTKPRPLAAPWFASAYRKSAPPARKKYREK
jgi:hypothetical protein